MAKNRKRRTPAVPNVTNSAAILTAGAVRNIVGGMLPLTVAPRARRHLAQHVSDITVAKAIAADRKARVLS